MKLARLELFCVQFSSSAMYQSCGVRGGVGGGGPGCGVAGRSFIGRRGCEARFPRFTCLSQLQSPSIKAKTLRNLWARDGKDETEIKGRQRNAACSWERVLLSRKHNSFFPVMVYVPTDKAHCTAPGPGPGPGLLPGTWHNRCSERGVSTPSFICLLSQQKATK